jgi:hypothetical protein
MSPDGTSCHLLLRNEMIAFGPKRKYRDGWPRPKMT